MNMDISCVSNAASVNKVKHHRPHGPGRACKKHSLPEKPSTVHTADPIAVPRTKRPYDSLRPTQKRQRRSELRAEVKTAAQRIGCPIEALRLQPVTAPEQLLHLSTSERERIRTVPSTSPASRR